MLTFFYETPHATRQPKKMYNEMRGRYNDDGSKIVVSWMDGALR